MKKSRYVQQSVALGMLERITRDTPTFSPAWGLMAGTLAALRMTRPLVEVMDGASEKHPLLGYGTLGLDDGNEARSSHSLNAVHHPGQFTLAGVLVTRCTSACSSMVNLRSPSRASAASTIHGLIFHVARSLS